MSSKLEAILLALNALLVSTGATVERNTAIPTRIPPAGLLILRDGEPGQPDYTLSPMTWHFEHSTEVEIFVQPNAALRDAAFDALKQAIGAALAANRTLGGLCDWAEALPPRAQDLVIDGTVISKAGTIPITLHYATTDPLS